MTGSRRRAALLSEYVDARLRRTKPAGADRTAGRGADGDEFDRLLDLARVMDELDLRPDEDETRRVFHRLETFARQEQRELATSSASARTSGWRAWWRTLAASLVATDAHGAARRERHLARSGSGAVPRLAFAILAATVALALIPLLKMEAPVTAAEVARRADAAAEGLALPGHVLHRRTLARIYRNDQPTPVSEEIVDEWTDGSQPTRLAARGRTRDGRLLWAQLNAWEEGAFRVQLYRSADSPFAPRDVVVLRPTLQELRDGAATFPDATRLPLLAYLDSGRAQYAPIVGDRSTNRAWIEASASPGRTAQRSHPNMLTVAPWTSADGAAGYELRTIQAGQPWLDWADGDTIVGRTMTVDTVRYLLASTWLTQRSVTVMTLSDGSTWRTTREVWFARQEPAAQVDKDTFRLGAPPSTRVLRISAQDELTALAAALTPPGRVTSRQPTN